MLALDTCEGLLSYFASVASVVKTTKKTEKESKESQTLKWKSIRAWADSLQMSPPFYTFPSAEFQNKTKLDFFFATRFRKTVPFPASWRQEHRWHIMTVSVCRKSTDCQVIPSEDGGRQWELLFSQRTFQWKRGESLPACCLNLKQTVSVWVTGLPTAIVTVHFWWFRDTLRLFQGVGIVHDIFFPPYLTSKHIKTEIFPQLIIIAEMWLKYFTVVCLNCITLCILNF